MKFLWAHQHMQKDNFLNFVSNIALNWQQCFRSRKLYNTLIRIRTQDMLLNTDHGRPMKLCWNVLAEFGRQIGFNNTPSPWLTRICLTRISLPRIFKKFHSSLNTYYETEIPSQTRVSIQGLLSNLVNTNFA